jgi:hypothetical protein
MSKKNKTKKKQQRNQRKQINQRNQNVRKTYSKHCKQRGGGFLDFIPSPFIDTTRSILTGFQNFKNQLYGQPLVSPHVPFVQHYRQI